MKKEMNHENTTVEVEKKLLIGERIVNIAKNIATTVSDRIDMERLSKDRQYLNFVQNDLIKPSLLKYAKGEKFIVQAYYQIAPQATPQLSQEELMVGTVVENKGNWEVICEHDLSYVKECNEDNEFLKWWYFECIRKGIGGWTRPYFDQYINLDVVTYSLPVYINSKLLGVVGIDLDYNDFRKVMNQRLLDSIGDKIETIRKEHKLIGEEQSFSEQFISVDTLKFVSKDDVTNGVVTRSEEMEVVMELAVRASMSDANVLLLGETGVGKDFLARYIHSKSTNQEGPYIDVNCTAIPETLLESEFFGYAKGAFTGAKNEGKIGFFEAANGGTIFLNEIGELPLHLQAKFLNVIQQKTITRIGETEPRKTSFRLIAATNRNLLDLIAQGTFREDLYYRLYVIPIFIPPLRERKSDIVTLLNYYLSQNMEKYRLKRKFSPEVFHILINYSWPGNIRELENLVERLIVNSRQTIVDVDSLPKEFLVKAKDKIDVGEANSEVTSLKDKLLEFEASLILDKYKELGSSYKVGEALGISQSQAYSKIKKYVKNPK
jgi:transcriptional regulator with PAS, ATPase and Fis domain